MNDGLIDGCLSRLADGTGTQSYVSTTTAAAFPSPQHTGVVIFQKRRIQRYIDVCVCICINWNYDLCVAIDAAMLICVPSMSGLCMLFYVQGIYGDMNIYRKENCHMCVCVYIPR